MGTTRAARAPPGSSTTSSVPGSAQPRRSSPMPMLEPSAGDDTALDTTPTASPPHLTGLPWATARS